MSACTVHPTIAAAADCEYCGQPHCAACLRPLLGRRYCPSCFARVSSLAGAPVAAVQAPDPAAAYAQVTPIDSRRPVMPGWASALIYLAAFVAMMLGMMIGIGIVVMLALVATGRPISELNAVVSPKDVPFTGAMEWVMLGATLLLTWGLARLIERKSLVDLGLPVRRVPFLRDFTAGFILAGLLFLSVVGVGIALGWYRLRPSAGPGASLAIAAVALVIFLPAAAVEEISMRGYVLQSLARSWRVPGAVAGSSLAFAAMHSLNPHMSWVALIGLVLAGVYLALAYLITGNLWLAIFLHACWNLMEGPVFGLPVSGIDLPASILVTTEVGRGHPFWTGGDFGPEAGMLLFLMLLLHLGVLWILRPVLRRGEPTATGRAIPVPESSTPAVPQSRVT